MDYTSINEKSKRNKYKKSMSNKINSNSNNNLNYLKSAFILRKIFDIIPKIKQFGIIKYNKKLQKRLDLSINDYKECFGLYTSVELEIKIANNEFNSFINISESDKKYYHIYFDDKKEEIKRNYLNKEDKAN